MASSSQLDYLALLNLGHNTLSIDKRVAFIEFGYEVIRILENLKKNPQRKFRAKRQIQPTQKPRQTGTRTHSLAGLGGNHSPFIT